MACGHSKGHSLQQAIVTAHDHSMTATPNSNWLATRFRFRQVPFLPLCSSSCDLFCSWGTAAAAAAALHPPRRSKHCLAACKRRAAAASA
jgi:hypothetical protein